MLRSVLLVVTPLALASCFTTAADFKNDAEDFIEENAELAETLGVDFTTATCEEPTSQDVGTEFSCTALDENDRSWEFSIEITGSNEYEVNLSRRP